MMPLLGFLAYAPQDPEPGYTEGIRVLAAFDVPAPYRWLDPLPTTPPQKDSIVPLIAGDGRQYNVFIRTATGRCWLVDREGWYAVDRPTPDPGERDQKLQIERAERSFRRLLGDDGIRPALLTSGNKGHRISSVILFDDYPLLQETSDHSEKCAVSVELDAHTGELLEYTDDVPRLTFRRTPLKVSQRKARETVERLIHVKPPDRVTQWYIDRDLTFDSAYGRIYSWYDPSPSLGWYQPKGSTEACLVWRIPYQTRWRTIRNTTVVPGHRVHAVLIDAATGKPLDLPTEDEAGPFPSPRARTEG